MYTRLYVRYYRSGIMFFLFLLMVELLLANQKKNRLLLWIQQGGRFFSHILPAALSFGLCWIFYEIPQPF